MRMTPEEYGKLSDMQTRKTDSARNITLAFLVGGAVCTFGEALLNLFGMLGFDEMGAGALTSVSLIFISAVLTGLGIYDNIAKFGGAGSLVPITGFANAVVSPSLEFKSEGYVPGLGAKLFIIAGPVILYGTVASVIYGIILYIAGV